MKKGTVLTLKKRTKATQFDKTTREAIAIRDGMMCIFCKMGYKMPDKANIGGMIFDTMHIVGKAQGGRGIMENGVLGCRYHHNMLDASLNRNEMMAMIDEYMKELYPNWNREDLVYDKTKP